MARKTPVNPNELKTCFRCSVTKPRSEYWGLGQCKECEKQQKREQYGQKNAEMQAKSRARRAADPERFKQYARKSYRNSAEKHQNRARMLRASNDIKTCAHEKIANEIKHGRMVRPDVCSECNASTSRIEAHHPDYLRPLEICWLCARCHRTEHKRLGMK